MDVRRMLVLRELSDRGSVAAVAAAMHVTPSAVSQQLKVLEREAGYDLVEPDGRGVRLTVAGRALAETATEIAVAVERAEGRWREFMGRPAGRVTLTTFVSGGEMLLPGLLTQLADRPDIELVCSDEDGAAVDFVVLTPEYDIVLADGPSTSPSWRDRGLRIEPLMNEPLDVALPAGHPLVGRRTLSPGDVADEPWIGVPVDYPYDRVLRQIEASAGRPVDVRQRFGDNGVVEAMVAAGHGIAILPRYTTRHHGSGLVMRPLTGIRASRDISALMRPDRFERPAVRAVVAALQQVSARVVERQSPT